MKIKSVSGIVYPVNDLQKTAEFYQLLGFEIRKQDGRHVTVYSNWFWIDFLADGGKGHHPGGISVYLSVDDVDGFYKELLTKGIKNLGRPADLDGKRAFTLSDPDGYHLVIFKN